MDRVWKVQIIYYGGELYAVSQFLFFSVDQTTVFGLVQGLASWLHLWMGEGDVWQVDNAKLF